MRAALLSLALYFVASNVIFGQTSSKVLDSLTRVMQQHGDDTLGVLAAADLCYEYRFINQDSALRYGEAGIRLGKKIRFPRGLAQVYSDAAFVHFDRSDFANAIEYWSKALKLRNELVDSPRVASLQTKLGAAYFRLGDYDTSLQYQLDALRTYERLGIAQGVGQALNNVAAVYEHQNHLDMALEYYQRAHDIHQSSGNDGERATARINIGNIYFRKKNLPLAKDAYKEAMTRLSPESQKGYRAIALNNLAEIFTIEGRYDSAQSYATQALALRREIGDFQGTVSSLNMLGRIETELNHFPEAERYLKAGLDSATGRDLVEETGRIQLNLYELYRRQGDWRKSLDAFVSYSGVKDSLMNENGRRQVAEMQVRYESEKKEQQIAIQEAELSEKEARIGRSYVTIGALALTVVLGGVIFVLLRGRQRRKMEIARKENEISVREAYIRASIDSQENERKRFARDLHDGMGQWISTLRISIGGLQKASSDEEKLVILERTESIMEQMNREFRSIAFNLMPETLIRAGLVPAVEEMVARLNSTGTVVFTVQAFGFPARLSEVEEILLYRVVQEWTNNILKYSSASVVSIQFTGHEDERVIMIEDDGKGFDPPILATTTGNGWKNIQSRLSLIGGSVDIDSSPARRGSTFTVTIPVSVHLPDSNDTPQRKHKAQTLSETSR